MDRKRECSPAKKTAIDIRQEITAKDGHGPVCELLYVNASLSGNKCRVYHLVDS